VGNIALYANPIEAIHFDGSLNEMDVHHRNHLIHSKSMDGPIIPSMQNVHSAVARLRRPVGLGHDASSDIGDFCKCEGLSHRCISNL
jgi:hypothetical protein